MSEPHYFIAVPVSPAVKQTLVKKAKPLSSFVSFKQWTYEEDYHITLFFLGAVSKRTLEVLREDLRQDAALHTSFSLQLNGLQTFGKPSSPRILWASVDHCDTLMALQQTVHDRCVTFDFKRDNRPYRPHITLAKKYNGNDGFSTDTLKGFDRWTEDDEAQWEVDHIALYRIHPTRRPKYEVIERFPLSKGS